MLEQRKQMRRRTLLDGQITIEKLNGWSLDCTVRNVSADGARIAIPEHVVVPELLNLSVSGGESRTARLVWFKGGQAGVEMLRRRADQPFEPDEPCQVGVNESPFDTVSAAASTRLASRIAAIAANRPRGLAVIV